MVDLIILGLVLRCNASKWVFNEVGVRFTKCNEISFRYVKVDTGIDSNIPRNNALREALRKNVALYKEFKYRRNLRDQLIRLNQEEIDEIVNIVVQEDRRKLKIPW